MPPAGIFWAREKVLFTLPVLVVLCGTGGDADGRARERVEALSGAALVAAPFSLASNIPAGGICPILCLYGLGDPDPGQVR